MKRETPNSFNFFGNCILYGDQALVLVRDVKESDIGVFSNLKAPCT